MADNYIERCTLRYEGVDLDDVIVSIEETDSVPTKVVNTMNKRKRGRGFKQSNSNYGLTLNAEQINDPRVPNWNQLKEQRKRFQLVKVPDKGKSVVYSPCVVSDVRLSTSDGDGSVTVTVMALNRDEQ